MIISPFETLSLWWLVIMLSPRGDVQQEFRFSALFRGLEEEPRCSCQEISGVCVAQRHRLLNYTKFYQKKKKKGESHETCQHVHLIFHFQNKTIFKTIIIFWLFSCQLSSVPYNLKLCKIWFTFLFYLSIQPSIILWVKYDHGMVLWESTSLY